MYMQDTADVASEARKVQTSQPCLIVRVADGLVKDGLLVIKKTAIAKVLVQQAMLVLFASFYTFNVHYPPGCCNFYLLYIGMLGLQQEATRTETKTGCHICRTISTVTRIP